MLALWLVRHAESTWNVEGRIQGWADPPLSERGVWQAQQVAGQFAGVPLAALYCSPQERAMRTAAAIAAACGVSPQVDERLREIGMGEATGVTGDYQELVQRWPILRDSFARGEALFLRIPGAETLEAVQSRAVSFLEDVRARHSEGHVMVVSHGGIFRCYLAHLLDAPFNGALSFGNTSISLVQFYDGAGVGVRMLNSMTHLATLGELYGSISMKE